MLGRDERRFKRADKNEDGKLNNEEFASFLHPENHDHMKGLVIDETLEDIDKDKDGSISLDEYIGMFLFNTYNLHLSFHITSQLRKSFNSSPHNF